MQNKGFTLVELAIALTVIGLMIGGVLKGEEALDAARRASTIEDVQSFRMAVDTFQEKYDSLPGDMTTASEQISGCPPPPSSPCDAADNIVSAGFGNGDDGIVGLSNWGASFMYQRQSRPFPQPALYLANNWQRVKNETTLFWAHLVMAGMITGATTAVISDTSTPQEWGITSPGNRYGGGYIVGHGDNGRALPGPANWVWMWNPTLDTVGYMAPKGLQVLIVRRVYNGSWGGTQWMQPGIQLLTAKQAKNIDAKIDDGLPNSGKVLALGAGASCFGDGSVWPPAYQVSGAAGVAAGWGKGSIGGGGISSSFDCNLSVRIE